MLSRINEHLLCQGALKEMKIGFVDNCECMIAVHVVEALRRVIDLYYNKYPYPWYQADKRGLFAN